MAVSRIVGVVVNHGIKLVRSLKKLSYIEGSPGTFVLKSKSQPKMSEIYKNVFHEKLENAQREFDVIFGKVVDDLVSSHPPETADTHKRFQRLLEYNVPHGKRNRGLALIYSYIYLVDNYSTEDLRIAAIIGWCIEMLQAFFLVMDDIMDHSTTRRGQPCWYTLPDVGLNAVNDAMYMESAVYSLLKKHIGHKPFYVEIVELFHETTLHTIIGQDLDLSTSLREASLQNFTLERYAAIVKYKTAYYSFYLPIACALYMAGINDPAVHKETKTIMMKMGEYFQIQDDYLDCFGDPKVTGKVGTDIQDKKCSWLIVQALRRSNPYQLSLLQENYGSKESEKVEVVKRIYKELNLEEVYRNSEESSYSELISLIENMSSALPKEMFLFYASKIYRRMK